MYILYRFTFYVSLQCSPYCIFFPDFALATEVQMCRDLSRTYVIVKSKLMSPDLPDLDKRPASLFLTTAYK
jgi:hypothetical protein